MKEQEREVEKLSVNEKIKLNMKLPLKNTNKEFCRTIKLRQKNHLKY